MGSYLLFRREGGARPLHHGEGSSDCACLPPGGWLGGMQSVRGGNDTRGFASTIAETSSAERPAFAFGVPSGLVAAVEFVCAAGQRLFWALPCPVMCGRFQRCVVQHT